MLQTLIPTNRTLYCNILVNIVGASYKIALMGTKVVG